MAGTSSNKPKTDPSRTERDAPLLPQDDSATPTAGSLPEGQDVAAQAQPKDEQESPTTASAPDRSSGTYSVKVDLPGVPRAGQYEVEEGQHDPSLVSVPGLGQFQNGTTNSVSEEVMALFASHLQVSNIAQVNLPAGVTIEKEGE